MSNPEWCERFNTEVDFSELIFMIRQHKAILECLGQEAKSLALYACAEEQQADVRIDSEERYLPYSLLRHYGT